MANVLVDFPDEVLARIDAEIERRRVERIAKDNERGVFRLSPKQLAEMKTVASARGVGEANRRIRELEKAWNLANRRERFSRRRLVVELMGKHLPPLPPAKEQARPAKKR